MGRSPLRVGSPRPDSPTISNLAARANLWSPPLRYSRQLQRITSVVNISQYSMKFLVTTHDMVVQQVFSRAAAEMTATVEVCEDVKSGFTALEQQRFDVVVIDCDDVYQGSSLLRTVHASRPNKSSVVMAITNGATNAADAVDLGAQFVVAKPLSPDRARFELRRACQAMAADQRRDRRHSVRLPVFLSFGQVLDRRAEAFNLSLGGVGVRMIDAISDDELIHVRFCLPGCATSIQARGEIAWSDREGNIGIKFIGMSQGSLAMLAHWLERAAVAVSDAGAARENMLSSTAASY
jgi:CheY-like chemotaxis protein